MGGGGTGISVLDDALDASTQVISGGLVGFDGEKGFGKGVVSDTAVDALKDVTGATAAEDANKDARKRFEEEKKRAGEQRKESQNQTARDQLLASRAAGSARGNTSAQKSSASRVSSLGGDEQDFLGL